MPMSNKKSVNKAGDSLSTIKYKVVPLKERKLEDLKPKKDSEKKKTAKKKAK